MGALTEMELAKSVAFGVKQTTAEEFAERFDIPAMEGISLGPMPEWLLEAANAELAETFEQDYWQQIPETTRDNIQTHVRNGIRDGHSIRRIAANIEDWGAGYSKVRAMRVARTEVPNALNSGHAAGMAQLEKETGIQIGKEWLSVLGNTTRHSHARMDGKRTETADGLFTLGSSKIPWPAHHSLPPGERINCQAVLPDSRIQAGEILRAYRAWYVGEVTKVVTLEGHSCFTANHPVATVDGFIAAGKLKVGQHVLTNSLQVPPVASTRSMGMEDVHGEPASIADIFDAMAFGSHASNAIVKRMRCQDTDFHGDAKRLNGYVYVVGTECELRDTGVSCSAEEIQNLLLMEADADAVLPASSNCFAVGLEVSSYSLQVAGITSSPSRLLSSAVFGIPNRDAVLNQGILDRVSTDSELSPDSSKRRSISISPSGILHIERWHYDGPVYDLTTKEGLYLTGNILASNCTIISAIAGATLDIDREPVPEAEEEKPQPEAPPEAPSRPPRPRGPKPIPHIDDLKPDDSITLGGSTGARLFRDADGVGYVVKEGSSPDHLKEEFISDSLYRAAGVNVPEARLILDRGAPKKVSRFIEGGKEVRSLGEAARKRAIEKARKDFGTDALLANWDAAGLDLDNMLVDKTGKVWRIDNGGALRFRAQGGRKGDLLTDNVLELWTMRERGKPAAKVFGGMTNADILKSAKRTLRSEKKMLKALADVEEQIGSQPELRTKLNARLSSLKTFKETSDTFQKDAWNDDYIDLFTKHEQQLEHAGVFANFAKRLKPKRGSRVDMVDENGKDWNDLRGSRGVSGKLRDYMDERGINYDFVTHYAESQAGNSWSQGAVTFKYHLALSRNVDVKEYWWQGNSAVATKADAERRFMDIFRNDKARAASYREAMTIEHAMTYNLMKRTKMPNSNQAKKLVSVVRTESSRTAERYGLKEVGDATIMKRGLAESYSLNQTIVVEGDIAIYQELPFHRVFAHYGQGRQTRHGGFLYGDNENELVCMSQGFESVRHKRVDSWEPVLPAKRWKRLQQDKEAFDKLQEEERDLEEGTPPEDLPF